MKWIYFCLIGFLMSYTFSQTQNRQKAIEFNNEASELYKKSWGDTKTFKQVLRLLDKAIKEDSTYEIAYINKANHLCELGRYKSALKVLDRLATVHPENPGYLSMGGYILERIGRIKEARKRYLQDIAKCDTIIKNLPDTLTIPIKIWRANLLMFIKGKKEGIREYERIAKEYPKNELVIDQREIFYNFNRKIFIENYCK